MSEVPTTKQKMSWAGPLLLLVLVISGAGYFAMEQTKDPEAGRQAQEQGNALEMFHMIRVSAPQPNDSVRSPLLVQGRARGTWYAESIFPVRVVDGSGKELGSGVAQALGDWRTEEFVSFQVTIPFAASPTAEGMLFLERNSSAGTEVLRVPLRFQE